MAASSQGEEQAAASKSKRRKMEECSDGDGGRGCSYDCSSGDGDVDGSYGDGSRDCSSYGDGGGDCSSYGGAVLGQQVDVVLEVMRKLDAASLGRCACVCRLWRNVAADEALWKSLVLLHWPSSRSSSWRSSQSRRQQRPSEQQIGAVVSALGGFRNFFSRQLRNRSSSSSSSSGGSKLLPRTAAAAAAAAAADASAAAPLWDREELHLSMSLYSIDCFLRDSLRINSSSKLLVSLRQPNQLTELSE